MRLFVSPAGQVFRPAGEEGRPFDAWFRQADANGDGVITYGEFSADFARAFAAFDLNHDGEIGPEEVAHYETDVLPEMATGFGRRFGNRGRGEGGDFGPGARNGGPPPRSRGDGGGGFSVAMSGAARFGLLPIPHPIMDADANFNRGVTREEFEAAAQRRFTALDTAHDGRLTAAGLMQARMQMRGPRGRRGGRSGDQALPIAGTPLPQD